MKKKILVFAGPSGVGKSTLSNYLFDNYDNFQFSISATTRLPRDGESHAEHYYFLSLESFEEKIRNNEFVEWEEVYKGRYYGTLKSEIEKISEKGNVAVFDIDVLGALNIKKMFADEAYIVFVKPESIEALKKRLLGRGTESAQELDLRMNRFEKELSLQDKFDDIITNRHGELDESFAHVKNIVEKEF